MNKTLVAVIVIVLLLIGGWAIYQNQNPAPASGEPIKIGYIGPLSGDAAVYGETEKNIIGYAIDDINKNGGISGQPLEIIYEDGKCNGKDATTAAQKLISVDHVQIILGGVCSSETLAAAPIAEKGKVILLSGFSSSPDIAKAGEYIFRNAPSDADVAKLDAETIAAKYKKVAILSENADYSLGIKNVMKEVFSSKDVQVVADENYTGATSDFRSILTKIKSVNPDVLYVNPGSSPKDGGLIAKQARELGIAAPIHGNFLLGTLDALAAGGDALEGVVISDSIELNADTKNLKTIYKEKFGTDPAHDLMMGTAYDRAYIIKMALDKVGNDATKIKDYLNNMGEYKGVIGSYTFDDNGDLLGQASLFTEVVIKNGQKVPYTGQ
jgi:branched-chain amino acid transport system substrate-binding protein